MTPHNSPAPIGATSGRLVNQALAELTCYKQTYQHALEIGIRPRDLVCYVKGTLDSPDKRRFERLLIRSPWAMNRVTTLVKARRHEDWLGFRAHTIEILNHYARTTVWIDEDIEGCKLLDRLTPDPT